MLPFYTLSALPRHLAYPSALWAPVLCRAQKPRRARAVPLVAYSVPRVGTQKRTLVGVLSFGATRKLNLRLLTTTPLLAPATAPPGVTTSGQFDVSAMLRLPLTPFRGPRVSSRLQEQSVWWSTTPFVSMPLSTVLLTKLVGVTIRIPLDPILVLETTFPMLLQRLARSRAQTIVITGPRG